MANLNKVFLMGNLTRDPELRYTPQGIAVTNLRIAVNRRFRNKIGEQKEETCFVTVVVWDKQAEICNQYLSKGKPVFVEGRLISRSWEDDSGQKRSVLEVRAERVQFLPPLGKIESPPIEEEFSEESSLDTWLKEDEEDNIQI
jgi:single-strand DNA-binding protein